MTGAPMESERGAPVVEDQRDVRQRQRIEPGVEVARVIDESIVDCGLTRLAHADQVGSETAPFSLEARDDVAPEIGRRRIAVQEDDRLARAGLTVVDGGIEDRDVVLGHGAIVVTSTA